MQWKNIVLIISDTQIFVGPNIFRVHLENLSVALISQAQKFELCTAEQKKSQSFAQFCSAFPFLFYLPAPCHDVICNEI